MSDHDPETHSDSKRKGSALPWLLLILVLLGGGAAAYWGIGHFEQLRARAEHAEKQVQEAESKRAEAEAGRRALDERVQNLEVEKTDLSEEVREKESELEKLKATYDSLEEKMTAEIKKGEIRLSQAGGRIRVDMVDKILFDSGAAELTNRGTEVLSRIGAALSKVDDKQIQVSGHTDDSPIADKELRTKYPSNWELSVARAVNVVRFLTEKGGVPARRLVAAGHGQFQPVAANATHAGRARNRRIEILLTPVLDTKELKAKAKPAAAPTRRTAKR